MMARIGLLGGTFDPPHIGHLVVADQVLDQLGFDEVWLVVSNDPWQKTVSRPITPAADRVRLVEAAVDGSPGVRASAVEIEIGGPSYTVVTLEVLRHRQPGVEWLPIVGADAAAGLDTWHRAEELRGDERFVVVNRPGAPPTLPTGWDCLPVTMPALDISSTEIRAMVEAGRSIRHLCPVGVVRLIDELGLYRRRS